MDGGLFTGIAHGITIPGFTSRDWVLCPDGVEDPDYFTNRDMAESDYGQLLEQALNRARVASPRGSATLYRPRWRGSNPSSTAVAFAEGLAILPVTCGARASELQREGGDASPRPKIFAKERSSDSGDLLLIVLPPSGAD